MNKNLKKILCALLAVLTICSMAACRSGGGETTAPAETQTIPAETLPEGEGVEDWIVPDETIPASTEPDETEDPDTTEPEDPTELPEETTRPTQPKEDDDPSTQVSGPQTGSDEPVVLTYEEYMALSTAEQQAYYESFPSLEDYIAWHNAALAEYEENQDVIEATGPIDIGDYINP